MNKKEKIVIIVITVFAIFTLILTLSIFFYNVGVEEGKKTATITSKSVLKGVDISAWQAENYKEIIDKADYNFVICRAADGIDVDTNCDKAYQYAKSKGKLLGAYFFAYPELHDAEEYADFCASTIEGYVGEAIFILDCEINPTEEWILTWVREFERVTSVKPLVYANLNMIKSMNWSVIIDNGNRLWLAYYDIDDGDYHEIPDDIGEWSRDQVVLHQYTTAGREGSESLDLDVFFGDEEAWQFLAKKTN